MNIHPAIVANWWSKWRLLRDQGEHDLADSQHARIWGHLQLTLFS